MNTLTNCKSCGNKLKGKQTHFCSIKCKNKSHQCYPSQKQRGLARKLQLLKMAGGKCSRCGYKKNLSALSFHHSSLMMKEFKLDVRSLSNRKLKTVLDEFRKCKLLCHNCHSEIHNPKLDLDFLSLSRLL